MHPALTFKIKGRDEGERKWDQSLNDWISRGSDAIRGFFYVMHLSFDEPVVTNDRANRRIVTVAEGKVTIRENVEWPDEESISEGTEALPIAQ